MLMRHLLSKMLMNEADSSPGGGAPGSSDKPADPGAQAQGQAGAQTVTLEALTKLFTDHKNSVEASTRRMIEGALGKKPGKGGGKPPEPRHEDADDATRTVSAEPDMRAFDRATRRLDLTDKQLDRMERAFKAEAPSVSDLGNWVAGYLDDLGIGKKEDASVGKDNSQNSNNASQSAPKSPPSAAPGAAVPTDRPRDVTRWDEAQLRAFFAQKGGNPTDFGDPKNAKIWREISQLYETAAAQRRIVPDDPKR